MSLRTQYTPLRHQKTRILHWFCWFFFIFRHFLVWKSHILWSPGDYFWVKTKGGDIKHYFTVIYHDDSTDSPSFPPKYTILGQNRFLDHFLKISVPNSVFFIPWVLTCNFYHKKYTKWVKVPVRTQYTPLRHQKTRILHWFCWFFFIFRHFLVWKSHILWSPGDYFWVKTKGGDIKHYFTVIYHDDSTDSPSFPPK